MFREAQLDRSHPDALGAAELVVRTVAHIEALRRADAEPFARDLVDSWVGLVNADGAREHGRIDEWCDRSARPHVLDVVGARAAEAKAPPAPPQLAQHLRRPRPRHERGARVPPT